MVQVHLHPPPHPSTPTKSIGASAPYPHDFKVKRRPSRAVKSPKKSDLLPRSSGKMHFTFVPFCEDPELPFYNNGLSKANKALTNAQTAELRQCHSYACVCWTLEFGNEKKRTEIHAFLLECWRQEEWCSTCPRMTKNCS